jgi:hypothetical protein
LCRRSFDRIAKAPAPVGYVRSVEPPHSYLHDTASSVVHHEDYLDHRKDHALCGVAVENPAQPAPTIRPVEVCADCEAKLVEYHLIWWRNKAEALSVELAELQVKYHELTGTVDAQQPDAVENPESQLDESEAAPATLLGQARKELLELCQRFDGSVPYWRLKNTMDAFSDKLSADERVLLAQEIGADGSLIRWCTKEIEGLGWQITNSPVHADADTMMDAWTEDYYQTPKKTTKWRLGRSRSHDAS